jgi:hypothetical protein
MPVLLVTSYRKYVTFHCNYFLSQWSSVVYLILVVGTFMLITVLSVLYFSTYDGKKSKRSMSSINIVLFTLCWVVFFCVWCSQLYTSPFATLKGMFCVPLFLGSWGCTIFNCFFCWRNWFALYYQIWETCQLDGLCPNYFLLEVNDFSYF